MAVILQRKHLTVAQYHKMMESGILTEDDRLELLNGEIIEMSPIGSKHAHCVDQLARILIMGFGLGAVVRIQNPIELDKQSEPEPDLAIAKGPAVQYKDHHPRPEDILLLIEVADATLEKDREFKLPLYAKSGIPEVWIVNLIQSEIERYSHPRDSQYSMRQLYFPGDVISLPDFALQVHVRDIFS